MIAHEIFLLVYSLNPISFLFRLFVRMAGAMTPMTKSSRLAVFSQDISEVHLCFCIHGDVFVIAETTEVTCFQSFRPGRV